MKHTPKRQRSDSASYAARAHQNAAQAPLEPPGYVYLTDEHRPFWNAIVSSRARDTWNDSDLVTAATLARVQCELQKLAVDTDDFAKLSRLAMGLGRAVAVHPTATVGRAADMVAANTIERQARAELDDDDELLPRLRAV